MARSCGFLVRFGTNAPRQRRHERSPSDVLNLKLEIADRDALAGRRQMSERLGNKAVHGGCRRFPFGVQKSRRIVDWHLSREAEASIRQRFRDGFAGLEVVAHIAKQLGQYVLEGDETRGTPELIHDERLV